MVLFPCDYLLNNESIRGVYSLCSCHSKVLVFSENIFRGSHNPSVTIKDSLQFRWCIKDEVPETDIANARKYG